MQKNDFPTPAEILAAAQSFVAENHQGVWPEDDWFDFGRWDLNLWTDETRQTFITAYPIGARGATQTDVGLRIPANLPHPLRALASYLAARAEDGDELAEAFLPTIREQKIVSFKAGEAEYEMHNVLTDMVKNPDNMRRAYFISQLERDENGFIPCIAVEGELGYYRTDWRWNCDLETAKRFANEKNDAMGISVEEAWKIQLSTMRT